MTTEPTSPCWQLNTVPAEDLLRALARLVDDHNAVTARLLAHIAEVDARRLYLDAACPSMFVYLVERLHLSEPAAYKRLRAARAARRFPLIFDLVARGALHLAGVTVLAPHLTTDNHAQLLRAAVHKSKRIVEELVAAKFPSPDAPALIRRLPARLAVTWLTHPPAGTSPPIVFAPGAAAAATGSAPAASAGIAPVAAAPAAASSAPAAAGTAPAAAAPAVTRTTWLASSAATVAALAADRHRLQLTISGAARDKLRQAQDLLRHRIPDGDLNAVFERALDALLRDLRKQKFADTARPRPAQRGKKSVASRHIPNQVKREVAARDGNRCTYISPTGERCSATGPLEFHHLTPFARGGKHTATEITLRCRAHNVHAAVRDFGARHIAWAVRRRQARRQPSPGARGAESRPRPTPHSNAAKEATPNVSVELSPGPVDADPRVAPGHGAAIASPRDDMNR